MSITFKSRNWTHNKVKCSTTKQPTKIHVSTLRSTLVSINHFHINIFTSIFWHLKRFSWLYIKKKNKHVLNKLKQKKENPLTVMNNIQNLKTSNTAKVKHGTIKQTVRWKKKNKGKFTNNPFYINISSNIGSSVWINKRDLEWELE